MKTLRYITLCLFLLTSLFLRAQVGQHRQDFSVGVTGGYTLNKVSFYPSIKQYMKGGVMFGFASRYICEKYFNSICGIQLEVNYQDLGWKEWIEDNEAKGVVGQAYQRDLHCIEVPFLMQMGWGKEQRGFKFLIEAGPYVQYFFASKEHYTNFSLADVKNDQDDNIYRPNSVTYQYGKALDNKICYGIEAGAGVEFSSAVGHFVLSGRYCYGLGDMFDNSKKGKFGRSANGTIEVRLTYLFDLVKTKQDK